jgi:quercetin dioxygenase-like cupin family protein
MVQVQRWDTNRGLLTYDLVKALHDAKSFHVTRREFPPRSRFPGRTRAATWYVLHGSCQLHAGGEYALSAGDVATIPAGDHELAVGDQGVVLVQVWDLRPFMQ